MKTTLWITCLFLFFSGCRKKFDQPPPVVISEGKTITVSQLRARVPVTSSVYRFTEGDTSLYCTVTADETSGNFYGCVFARDDGHTAIRINLTAPGGLFTGDRIRINLNGVTVRHANNSFSLDSVSLAKNVVKHSSGNKVMPKIVTLHQLLQSLSGGIDLQSDLVQLNDVEFVYDQRGVNYADAIAQNSIERAVTSCDGYTVPVYTSGFANFAAQKTPTGRGSLSAIVTRHNNSLRLELRTAKEVRMNEAACTSSLTANAGTFVLAAPVATIEEHFDEVNDNRDVQKPGWINYNESGKARWKGNLKAGSYRAVKATAFGAGEKTVTWLISPPVKLSANMQLSFRTGVEYFKTGHIEPLLAYVSTDFDGQNLKTANWVAITQAAYAGSTDGNYNGPGGMKSSGIINLHELPLLKSAQQQTFCIAFKYTGEPGFDSNVYLDDVVVK